MSTKRLSIRRQGRGNTIIMLHGWGMNSSVFDGLCAELGETREVVRVDLPGYGGSDWDDSLSFADLPNLFIPPHDRIAAVLYDHRFDGSLIAQLL